MKSPSPRKLIGSSLKPALPATLFKAKCAETLDAVHELRRQVVVTKHGKPFVTIVPAEEIAPNPLGFMSGTVVAAERLVSAEADEWIESETDPLVIRKRKA